MYEDNDEPQSDGSVSRRSTPEGTPEVRQVPEVGEVIIAVSRRSEPSHIGHVTSTPERFPIETSPHASTNSKGKIRKRNRNAAKHPTPCPDFGVGPARPATDPAAAASKMRAAEDRHHRPPVFSDAKHAEMKALKRRRMFLVPADRARLFEYENTIKQAWFAARALAKAEVEGPTPAAPCTVEVLPERGVGPRPSSTGHAEAVTTTPNRPPAEVLPVQGVGQRPTSAANLLADEEIRESPTGDSFRRVTQQRKDQGLQNRDTCNEQPITEYERRLQEVGLTQNVVEATGNCCVLAPIAGREERSSAAIAHPTAITRRTVQSLRAASVNLITSTGNIGGIPAKAFRTSEGLTRSAQGAAVEMSRWRQSQFWMDDVPHRSATFLFGLAVAIKRPIIVLERDKIGNLLNPSRIYGARDKNGDIVKTAATSRSPAITPAYTNIRFDDILNLISEEEKVWSTSGQDPKLFSLVQFNRAKKHFTAWVRKRAPASSAFRIKKVKPPPPEEPAEIAAPPPPAPASPALPASPKPPPRKAPPPLWMIDTKNRPEPISTWMRYSSVPSPETSKTRVLSGAPAQESLIRRQRVTESRTKPNLWTPNHRVARAKCP